MTVSSHTAAVVPYRPRTARSDATAWLGMIIFLGSWSMMFAALFFAYAVLRSRAASWPPLGTPPLPLLLPAANTVVLAASGGALQRGLLSARRGYLAAVAPWVRASLGLGVVFLLLQCSVWAGLWRAGLRPGGGPFPSVFYGLTAFHALHVLVGVGGLSWLALRARSRAYGPGRHVALRLWTGFWHFVGVVWLLLFITVFVF